jgi:hypothetical protein
MFSRFARLCQPRVLILAAIAVVAVLCVPGGRAAMTLVSRPVGGVSATPEPTPTATAQAVTASASGSATTSAAAPAAAAAPAPPAATSKDAGAGVKTLFSDDFAKDPIGCLGAVASAVPQAGAAAGTVGGAAGTVTGTVSGAAGSVTGTVGSVTGSLPGAGSLTGTVTGTVGSVTGSMTGTACSLAGAAGAVSSVTGTVGSVTGTVSGVTGTVGGVTGTVGGATAALPGGWIVGGSIVPTVVQEGTQHVLARVDQSWSFLAAGSASWADYSVSSALRTDSGTGDAGVAARYQDSSNYYACEVDNGTALRMVKVVGGKLQVLTSTSKAVVGPGAFHTVGMVVKGSHLACTLNGAPALQAVDGALTHGQVALVGLDALPAEFGAVKVLSLPTA